MSIKKITVRATFDFEVDVDHLDKKHVDIEGLAIDLTKREIDTLSSEDFLYEIISKEYWRDKNEQ